MKVTLTVTAGPHQGRTIAFHEHDTFIVGRAEAAHFRLPHKDKSVSRYHFLVEVNPPSYRVLDMASTRGTYLNGVLVATADLKDGDTIRAGDTVLAVAIDPGEAVPDPSEISRTLFPAPPVAWPAPRDLPVIPGYRIDRELGRGGMGVVYLACDEADGAAVALKTIVPTVATNPTTVARFVREARILRQLDHPRIVQYRAVGEAGGRLYFAMEYAPGTDGAQLVERSGPLAIRLAVRIASEALEGLEHAHDRGFVHRDVKPHNLLLTRVDGRRRVKLADFGLARLYQNSPMSGLTVMGEIAGSIQFLPPEQVLDFHNVQPAADLYALGATLYYLLTGKKPYNPPEGAMAGLLLILNQDPIPIQHRRPDLPASLCQIVHRSLARNPADRFPDAASMRLALGPFLQDGVD